MRGGYFTGLGLWPLAGWPDVGDKLGYRLRKELVVPASLKQLEEQALVLPPEERARLAESLLESLHSPLVEIEQAWSTEIERRVDAFDHGDIPAYTAEDVFAEAKAKQTPSFLW